MKEKLINILIWVVSICLAVPAAIILLYILFLIKDRIEHSCPDVAIYIYCPE